MAQKEKEGLRTYTSNRQGSVHEAQQTGPWRAKVVVPRVETKKGVHHGAIETESDRGQKHGQDVKVELEQMRLAHPRLVGLWHHGRQFGTQDAGPLGHKVAAGSLHGGQTDLSRVLRGLGKSKQRQGERRKCG